MFHRVLPKRLIIQPNAYSTFGTLISQEYFEEILLYLTEKNYKFLTVSELKDNIDTRNIIALTFDDGYSDNYEYALPVMQKYNITATFFPVVEPCKMNTVLPLDIYYHCIDSMNLSNIERDDYIKGDIKKKFYWSKPEEQKDILKNLFTNIPHKNVVEFMNATQLKQLSAQGFEIGSHGMTHSLLTAEYMTEQKAIEELRGSKEWLESITGKKVSSYCFPAGRYNAKMIELARQAGYTSTCLVFRDKGEKEVLPSYDRVFVEPNSFNKLKSVLNTK